MFRHTQIMFNHKKQSIVQRLIKQLSLVILVMMTSWHSGAMAQTERLKILVVGDSLSAEYGIARNSGWVELLRRSLNDQTKDKHPNPIIINASISGDTTSAGLSRFESLLERDHPNIVILELGANDALRGLPLTQTRSNLETMIRAAKQIKAQVLILGMRIPPNYGRDYSEKFADIFTDLAIEQQCEVIPFFLSNIATQREMFQADGIHPTAQAQVVLMQTVKQVLEPMLNK